MGCVQGTTRNHDMVAHAPEGHKRGHAPRYYEVIPPDPDLGWRRLPKGVIPPDDGLPVGRDANGWNESQGAQQWLSKGCYPKPNSWNVYFYNDRSGNFCSTSLITLALNIAVRAELLAELFGIVTADSESEQSSAGQQTGNNHFLDEDDVAGTPPSAMREPRVEGGSISQSSALILINRDQRLAPQGQGASRAMPGSELEFHSTGLSFHRDSSNPAPSTGGGVEIKGVSRAIAGASAVQSRVAAKAAAAEPVDSSTKKLYRLLKIPDFRWILISRGKADLNGSSAAEQKNGQQQQQQQKTSPHTSGGKGGKESASSSTTTGIGGSGATTGTPNTCGGEAAKSQQIRDGVQTALDDGELQKFQRGGSTSEPVLADVAAIGMNVAEQLYRLERRQDRRHLLPTDTFGWKFSSAQMPDGFRVVVTSPDGDAFWFVPEEMIMNVTTWVQQTYLTSAAL